MKPPLTVQIADLTTEPYASIVCYPKPNPAETQRRIQELHQLGVSEVEFTGKVALCSLPILGKGYVGVVVAARVGGKRVALKMRRLDADRKDFGHEAEMLQKANQIDVGPKFIAVSNNFLLSQLVDGDLLEDWLKTLRDKDKIEGVLLDILEQCWRLDEAGLDHGEISKAPKHVLVDKSDKPFIVDFETASIMRKVINVTSICQFLFLGNSQAAKILEEVVGRRNESALIGALKAYKANRTRQNFDSLVALCLSS